MTDNGHSDGVRRSGLKVDTQPLPKRFYKDVSVAERASGYVIQLDGRTARTPSKTELILPSAAMADAVAAEWAAQDTEIDVATMPLTRLTNTAIDGVAARMSDVREDIVKYAGSDLLCYRADTPEGLVISQQQSWDPVLDWARQAFGVDLRTVVGIMPVAQSDDELAKLAKVLADEQPFPLTALHVMTTLTGSALLALAVRHGRLDASAAWAAAHVDEDWQISQWGEDAEAKARRAHRWRELAAAAECLSLIGAIASPPGQGKA